MVLRLEGLPSVAQRLVASLNHWAALEAIQCSVEESVHAQAGAEDCRWTLLGAARQADALPTAWITLVDEQASHCVIVLGVTESTRQELADASTWRSAAPEHRILAWALVHEALVGALDALTGRQWVPVSVREIVDPAENRQLASKGIRVCCETGEDSITVWLGLNTASQSMFVCRLASWCEGAGEVRGLRRGRLPASVYETRLALQVSLPVRRLPLDVIEACCAGDRIYLGQTQTVFRALTLVVPGNPPLRLAGRWVSPGVEIELIKDDDVQEELRQEVNALEEEECCRTESPAAPELANVDVEVSLPGQTVSLSELSLLSPGSVLETTVDLACAAVTLAVQGTAFAEGRLVTVADKLAVQIDKVF